MNTIPFGMPEEMCLSALCDAGETMRHTPSGRDLSRRRQNILRRTSSGCPPGLRRARKAEIPTKRRTRLPQENRVLRDALF